ncbi:MAG: amidohydrolase family protein [Pirellulales bacterium]
MTRVDSHLHVWRATSGQTPGITTLVPPETDVPIDAAVQTLAEHGIDRAVLVQPVYPGEDNSYVAACARAQPDKLAAVCVVDPRTAGADGRLAHWAAQGCRGLRLRPRIAAEVQSFGDPATFPLWEAAARLGIVVSVLSDPAHHRTIAELAGRFPRVPIVIDHLGHPDVEAGASDPAFQQLLDLAAHPSVFVKLSGFYHFSHQAFPFRDCWELTQAVYDAFGPARLLWGSDYPHVTVTCGYQNAIDILDHAVKRCPEADRLLVMGGNALRLYWPADV